MNKQGILTDSVNLNKLHQQAMIATLILAACMLSSSSAFAFVFNATGIATVLCNAVLLVVFDIGRGIASLAIIAIGVAAMIGRATWGQALSLGVGIGVVFGSITIATALTTSIPLIGGLTVPALPCS